MSSSRQLNLNEIKQQLIGPERVEVLLPIIRQLEIEFVNIPGVAQVTGLPAHVFYSLKTKTAHWKTKYKKHLLNYLKNELPEHSMLKKHPTLINLVVRLEEHVNVDARKHDIPILIKFINTTGESASILTQKAGIIFQEICEFDPLQKKKRPAPTIEGLLTIPPKKLSKTDDEQESPQTATGCDSAINPNHSPSSQTQTNTPDEYEPSTPVSSSVDTTYTPIEKVGSDYRTLLLMEMITPIELSTPMPTPYFNPQGKMQILYPDENSRGRPMSLAMLGYATSGLFGDPVPWMWIKDEAAANNGREFNVNDETTMTKR